MLANSQTGGIMKLWRGGEYQRNAARQALRGPPATLFHQRRKDNMSNEERKLTPQEIEAEVQLKQAEAEKALAEAELTRQEVREAKAKAATTEYMERKAAIELAQFEEKSNRVLLNNAHRHVYVFEGPVIDDKVKSCIDELTYWHRSRPGCPITIVLDSPGGAVIPGMALYDYLRYLSRSGHHITTICSGYAASMAGIILQAGDLRICGAESYILIHEISAGAMGKIGEIEDEVAFYKKICERVLNIFVKRSGGKLTKTVMKKNWTRKDWWLSSDDALKLGIVDEVR